MQVYNNLQSIHLQNSVVTIGGFDGIHLGHQKIIYRLTDAAQNLNSSSVLITFWPTPRMFFNREGDSFLIMSTITEKINLLEIYGVEHLIILPFNQELASVKAIDFIRKTLVDTLHIRHLIMGYNHNFGYKGEGNFALVEKLAPQFNFSVERVEPFLLEGQKISSSKIRELIESDELELANQYLGHPYTVTGAVVEGNKIGRTIGFPTANIFLDNQHKLIPVDGVYAVYVIFNNQRFKGMLNIGHRPTIKANAGNKTVEVNIFDFNKDIYNQEISIEFIQKTRSEIKFDSLETLKNQIAKDKNEIEAILS